MAMHIVTTNLLGGWRAANLLAAVGCLLVFAVPSASLAAQTATEKTASAETSNGQVNVLVPAYANPCCDGGPRMWKELIATAKNPKRNFELHLIFNPASGPGPKREPNYLSDQGAGPLADVRAAGAVVFGYVPTDYGRRKLDDAKQDIDQYLVNQAMYAGFVDGIFFDEMSSDLKDVGYYRKLRQHVVARLASAKTIGNPGTHATANSTGQTDFTLTDYAQVFDTVMTFENKGEVYQTKYQSPAFVNTVPASGFAHAIHSTQDWDAKWLPLASQRKAGFVYFTNDPYLNTAQNPWDTLSQYWPAFVDDLIEFNARAAEQK